MKKYSVTRMIIYKQEVEVEASSAEEAIELAQWDPLTLECMEFVDTDYYEAEPLN